MRLLPSNGPRLLAQLPVTDALAVRDIEFSYGRLQVLFGVSFEVRQGEAFALLGTNGAGKSTLLRVVAGLERPSAGSVRLGDEDITGVGAEHLVARGLVLVPGGRAVFPDLTVFENIEVQALTVRGRGKEWFGRRCEVVVSTFPDLRQRWSQPAAALSGGQQQQLALAKALLLEPRVLCIDELSLGLAPLVVHSLLKAVRSIQTSGVTVVLVEQSLNIAAEICERAVFLEKGAVVFEGRVADLLERDDIARAVFLGGHPKASSNGSRCP
jgi:ABC-type branched-subunit amino acid transport system ATPase component